MKRISQIARQTGISVRTLQYYDEIGLLRPSTVTSSGYRLYDDNALKTLQQILFFKELGFSLKEIHEIITDPDFDQIAAFQKQKELFLLKRRRIDQLIQLLERLEKRETYISFQEFDLSDYIHALEDFKSNQMKTVMQHWGSIENFNMFIQKIKDDEYEIAKLAIKQFGSVERYTEVMKYNLDHFCEIMETQLPEEAVEIGKQTDLLYDKLTADLSEDVSSPKIQSAVNELLQLIQKNSTSISLGKPYIDMLINAYSNDYVKKITDNKYKKGASDYIVKALQTYASRLEDSSIPQYNKESESL